MKCCEQCGSEYTEQLSQTAFTYTGGVLNVTDVPVWKCDCDILELLENKALVDYFVQYLEKQNMIGDISISLEKIKSNFELNNTLLSQSSEFVEHNAKLYEQMEWMKEQLGLQTAEQLLSKALSFLHVAIELEKKGYSIKGSKNLGYFEGKHNIHFTIRGQ